MTNTKAITREQGTAAVKEIMADPRFDATVKTYIKAHCAYPDASTIIYSYGDNGSTGYISMSADIIPWVDEIFRAI